MAKSLLIIAVTLCVLSVVLEQNQVEAACCGSNFWTGSCGDGSRGTPCCATQTCNAFCCACAGSCRGGRAVWKRDVTSGKGDDHFSIHDQDGDGHHDIKESHQMFTSGSCGNNTGTTVEMFKSIFDKFDKNHDGKLSYDEINER